MIPKLVLDLCDTLLAVDGAIIKEDHRVLRIVNTECPNDVTLKKIKTLHTQLATESIGKCLIAGEIIQDVEIEHAQWEDFQDETIQFVIRKNNENGRFYYFTLEGLAIGLQDKIATSEAAIVWVAADFNRFATWSTWFLPWGEEPTVPLDGWQGLENPKKLVRDLTRSHFVIDNIKPWLICPHVDALPSDVLNVWKVEAAKNLRWVLPQEIEGSMGQTVACFKADRLKKCSINHEGTDWLEIFDPLSKCASWIYTVRQEAESKHILLNYHLAIELKSGDFWPDRYALSSALINAKEAYRLHLTDSSKEALNSLATLKKTLHEEVGRVVESTHKLSSNLWRDFIIVISVIVLRFTVESRNLPKYAVIVVGCIVILFIAINFLTAIIVNQRFFKIAETNRKDWRKKIYQFLDEQGYEKLVSKPVLDAQSAYSRVACVTGFLYIIIIAILCYLLFFKIEAAPQLITEMFVRLRQ